MLFPLLLSLAGCLFVDEGDLGDRQDVDGDGILATEDCDDTDAAIGEPTAWYLDGDDDGYGDPDLASTACEPPTDRHLGTAGDCDDGDAAVNPGAAEICDGTERDEDCDGLVDDADDSAPLTTWYEDADLDDWGRDDSTRQACEPGPGWSEAGGDCDDDEGEVHPGAAEECGDGVDQDCLPSPECRTEGDQRVTSVADGRQITLEDAGISPGAFGFSVAHVGDVDGDGLGDFAAGATGVDGDLTDREIGAVYIFSCPPVEAARASSALIQLLGDEAGARAGSAIASAGDQDGDGHAEVLVGSPDSSTLGPGTGAGEAHLIFGGTAALSGTLGVDERVTVLSGGASGDQTGFAVQHAGDFDGDGFDDLLVAAPGGRLGERTGVVYLVRDEVLAGNSYTLTDVAIELESGEDAGIGAGSGLGEALAGGTDLDGDGYSELLLGEPERDDERGRALMFRGQATLTETLGPDDAAATVVGESAGDLLGTQVHLSLDLDPAGASLLIAAPLAEDDGTTSGVIYLVPLPSQGGTVDLAQDDAGRIAPGTEAFFLGLVLAAGGDLNGDGTSDLAAYSMDQEGLDVVSIFYGPLSLDTDADAAPWHVFTDDSAFGGALALGSDLTGDGVGDLLVGQARGVEDGAIWVLPGSGE